MDGAGADGFVFDAGLVAGYADHIADFRAVADTVHLLRTEPEPFRALAFGVLRAKACHVGMVAIKAGQHILYDRETGLLACDGEGAGSVLPQVFASLDHGPGIGAADFFVL